jgi:hypothetical protein
MQGNPQPTDLHYFLNGTGHLFNKNHALESLRRLRGLGEGMVEDLAHILREAMDNPQEFSTPPERMRCCSALLLLYEWNYPGLFEILSRLISNDHELGQEILLSECLSIYPQLLIRCKSFDERLALCESKQTEYGMRVISLESLVISGLHEPKYRSQVAEICHSFWQKKTPKTPEIWGVALYGSLRLCDKKRAEDMMKAAKNKQLSEWERKSIVAAIKSLKESTEEEFIAESKKLDSLNIDLDICDFFSNLELFESLADLAASADGLSQKRAPHDDPPELFYVFEIKMQNDDFTAEIRIADNLTFYELHEAILASLEWDDDHLFAFYLDNKFRGSQAIIDGDPETDEHYAGDVFLADTNLTLGQKIGYLFDFGDNHEFVLSLSRIEEYDPREKDHTFDYRVLTRDAPPEQYTED